MPKDLRETIKGERTSHLSSPVGNDTEFHLRLAEIGMKPKQKQKYYVCFPVECVSDAEKGTDSNGEDHEMARFVQMGKPHIEAMAEESKEVKANKKLKAHIKENY